MDDLICLTISAPLSSVWKHRSRNSVVFGLGIFGISGLSHTAGVPSLPRPLPNFLNWTFQVGDANAPYFTRKRLNPDPPRPRVLQHPRHKLALPGRQPDRVHGWTAPEAVWRQFAACVPALRVRCGRWLRRGGVCAGRRRCGAQFGRHHGSGLVRGCSGGGAVENRGLGGGGGRRSWKLAGCTRGIGGWRCLGIIRGIRLVEVLWLLRDLPRSCDASTRGVLDSEARTTAPSYIQTRSGCQHGHIEELSDRWQ